MSPEAAELVHEVAGCCHDAGLCGLDKLARQRELTRRNYHAAAYEFEHFLDVYDVHQIARMLGYPRRMRSSSTTRGRPDLVEEWDKRK